MAGAVGKVEIPLLLWDFPAEWESPALGLFRAAAFSPALLPTNGATEPLILLRQERLALSKAAGAASDEKYERAGASF